jgi:hypothetical protein
MRAVNNLLPAGKPSLLRGINLGNWLVPEGYMWHLNNGGLRDNVVFAIGVRKIARS